MKKKKIGIAETIVLIILLITEILLCICTSINAVQVILFNILFSVSLYIFLRYESNIVLNHYFKEYTTKESILICEYVLNRLHNLDTPMALCFLINEAIENLPVPKYNMSALSVFNYYNARKYTDTISSNTASYWWDYRTTESGIIVYDLKNRIKFMKWMLAYYKLKDYTMSFTNKNNI
jgi:hypothetical protein